MTHLGYLIVGWSATLITLGSYIYFVLRRGRRLIKDVPEARRYWSSSGEQGLKS